MCVRDVGVVDGDYDDDDDDDGDDGDHDDDDDDDGDDDGGDDDDDADDDTWLANHPFFQPETELQRCSSARTDQRSCDAG